MKNRSKPPPPKPTPVKEKPIGTVIKNEIGQREDVAAVGLSRARPQKDPGQGSVCPGAEAGARQEQGSKRGPGLLRKDRGHWGRTRGPGGHWGPQVIAGARVEEGNTHVSRGSFIATDWISFFSTNSLPLSPHGYLSFEFPDFMMNKLCFNVY